MSIAHLSLRIPNIDIYRSPTSCSISPSKKTRAHIHSKTSKIPNIPHHISHRKPRSLASTQKAKSKKQKTEEEENNGLFVFRERRNRLCESSYTSQSRCGFLFDTRNSPFNSFSSLLFSSYSPSLSLIQLSS